MSVDLEALKRKLRTPINGAVRSRVVLTLDEADAIIAVWEHAECVEMALAELVKRASDPDIEATAAGARIMLDEAIREARILLKGPGGA